MFCPNCGKQNKDDVAACAFCGHGLQKPKPRFKGTMMMNAPAGAPPPAAKPPAPAAPPPAAKSPAAPAPARSPKKTMVGGFAMPPGGLAPPAPAAPPPAAKPAAQDAPVAEAPAAEAESARGPVQSVGTSAKNPAFQKTIVGGMPAMAPPSPESAAPTTAEPEPAAPAHAEPPAAPAEPASAEPAWGSADDNTPPGGLGGPVQAGGLGASKNLAFQKTMVGGMPAMAPPAPQSEGATALAEEPGSSAPAPAEPAPAEPARAEPAPAEPAEPAPAEEPVSERRAPRLDVDPRESMPSAPPTKSFGWKLTLFLLLGLALAAGGAYAVGLKIGAFGGGSPADALVETHRFWLRGQLQMVRFTCAEDPSGVTAAAALGLPEGSPLGAAACKIDDAALAVFNDPAQSPGALLENPPRAVETADGAFEPSRCVAFTAGGARIVTCEADDTKLQVADLHGLDSIE